MSKVIVMGWMGDSRFREELESEEQAKEFMDHVDYIKEIEAKKGCIEESDWPKITKAMNFVCGTKR